MEVKLGYKQTDVGVIPEEWEAKSLGTILSKGRLGGNYANQDAEAELPLMKMGNLARGYFDLSKVQFITPGVRPELSHRLVYGDVLFNTRNTLELVGKVAIWRDELPVAYYNSNLMRLEFDPGQVCSNEYANYSLNTEGAVSRLRGLATGTTSVAAIYVRDLMKLRVLVPPKPEQRAIATALSDTDGLLGGLDRLIAKKRDLKHAAMQQLLTGETRLPGYHGEWKSKTFSELLKYERPDKFLVNSADYLEKGDIPVLTANKTFILGYTNDEFGIFKRLPAIIFDDFTTDSKYVDFPFKVKSSAIKILKARTTEVNLQFIFARMRLVDFPVAEHKRYYISEYQHIELPTPKSDEQTGIAGVLTDMNAELAGLEQRREKTRALKQAMMQELLTGRTRLV
jgi:type I restriction enzyme S subunit